MTPHALLPWLIAAPLASATVLLLWRTVPDALVRVLGVGSVSASALMTAALAVGFDGGATTVVAWQWMAVEGFTPAM